ncbi:hypothetical protein AcV7_000640 [Taiwanofungus camphoratus]|nr:hypothetical protein AcV7_000640 [Antrodia cinnamomea]
MQPRDAGSTADREFYVSVELYISAKTAMTLRKPTVLYKKSHDKLEKSGDPSRVLRGVNDGHQKRVKEKSSWLSLGRNPAGTGQWRSATCKLVEDEEACLLNIYIDQETMLHRTVYVDMLYHTDIRPVHRSLLDRRDCLGIFCVAGQTWSPAPTAEPVILYFADPDMMKVWLALLRSYAMPEVYGRWLSPEDGGLYRMWRQVELTCLQGRNLGTSRPLSEDTAGHEADARSEGDAIDMDVYCEIFVNGCLSGRTTVKKGIGSPDWQERFTFSDLPPFENLEIVVFRDKKLTKPTVVGTVTIVLVNFRRGEYVEGWFPVLYGGPTSSVQAGEMRLRVKVDEEIILPYSAYSGMLNTFNSRNCLDWMTDLESKLKLRNVSNHIISIAIAKNVLVDNIMELADREVDGTLTSHNTLFRGNTVLTKTMELFMSWYGASFLEASIGPTIRRLCAEKVAIEVDPARSGKGAKSTEKSVELLVHWCQELWTCIYDARRECPPEMRRLFEHIRQLVEKRYRSNDDKDRRLPWQSVSAFCFLRFIVPAILHPHLFGLWPGLPDARVQRSLTLIAKVIQNLANLNATVQKEEFMRGVKDFLTGSLQAMIDYIIVVSTPEREQHGSTTSATDRHQRLRIMNALRQRGAAAPVLHREATPLLPHLLDIPKHLAVVTSVVVRYSRSHSHVSPSSLSMEERYFDEFCSRCLEVEEQALRRVSQIASRPRRKSAGPRSPHVSPVAAEIPLPPSPTSPVNKSPRKRPRMKESIRPSTAPSGRDSPEISHSTEPSSQVSRPLATDLDSVDQSLSSISRSETNSSQPPSVGDVRNGSRSLRRPRERFAHQPRSSSTDSALLGKDMSGEGRPSHQTSNSLTNTSEDAAKKRRSIFRGILTRR